MGGGFRRQPTEPMETFAPSTGANRKTENCMILIDIRLLLHPTRITQRSAFLCTTIIKEILKPVQIINGESDYLIVNHEVLREKRFE